MDYCSSMPLGTQERGTKGSGTAGQGKVVVHVFDMTLLYKSSALEAAVLVGCAGMHLPYWTGGGFLQSSTAHH